MYTTIQFIIFCNINITFSIIYTKLHNIPKTYNGFYLYRNTEII